MKDRCPVLLFLTTNIKQLTAVSVTLDTKENDARGVSYASLLLIAGLHARARSSILKKIWLSIHLIKNHVTIRSAGVTRARKNGRALVLSCACYAGYRTSAHPSAAQGNQCEMSNVVASVGACNLFLT